MTAPITPDERAEWRALADAATPGPWEAHEGTVGAMTGPRGCGGCSGLVSPRHEPACFWSEVAGAAPADAAFIAAARAAVPRLLDALDTAEAEVARLREEAARPAPVWDEDTVYAEVDREALRRFVDSFCDDEAGEVEHVLSADGTSGFALTGGNDAHAVLRKAASALWPGESRATVQAEALRDAADEYEARLPDGTGNGRAYNSYTVAAMLRARADRLEKGADRG